MISGLFKESVLEPEKKANCICMITKIAQNQVLCTHKCCPHYYMTCVYYFVPKLITLQNLNTSMGSFNDSRIFESLVIFLSLSFATSPGIQELWTIME